MAFVRYDLAANIDIGFRWMLAALVLAEVALVAIALALSRHGSPHAWWPVAVAALPAVVGVAVYAVVGAIVAGA